MIASDSAIRAGFTTISGYPIRGARIFHISRNAGLLAMRLRIMTFTETRERTGVTVALRNEPISDPGELIRFAIGECSLGSIIAAVTEKGICAILLGDNPSILRRELQEHFKLARLVDSEQDLGPLMAEVARLVESPWLNLDLKFDLRGTSF